jgi:hypothetical protein
VSARAIVVAFVIAPAVARADPPTVTVTLTPTGQELAQTYGDSEQSFIQKAVDGVNSYYQTARVDQVLGALLSATAFANNEVGVDHDVRPGARFFGVSAEGALTNDPAFVSSLASGAVIDFNLTGGVNLARHGHARWTIFANAGYAEGSLYSLQGHMYSGGAHVQYKAIGPSAPGGVRWIGLDVTTGAEVSRWELGNGLTPIVVHFTLHAAPPNTASTRVTLTSNGTLSLVATTFAIPIEVSTGVRLGEHFTLYAGGGPDVVVGSATLTAQLDGAVTQESDSSQLATVTIIGSANRSAGPLTAHALAGMQLNAGHVHLYVQGVATPDVYGATFGVRAVW